MNVTKALHLSVIKQNNDVRVFLKNYCWPYLPAHLPLITLNSAIMKTNARFLAPFFLVAILLTSCQTARKFTESGDYDSAIELCVRKLRGKEDKKQEYVQGLEVAFQKAQERDLALVNQLIAENRPSNWERIHDLHLLIRSRQDKVRPLIPLKAKNGYTAHFDLVEIGRMESESRAKAADYLYNKALSLIETAEKGYRHAARDAYDALQEIGRCYYSDYRDKEKLLAKAHELGTAYVLVRIDNRSGSSIPRDFEERLLAISKLDLDDEWRAFFFDEKPGETFDYEAVIHVNRIDISPERFNERNYEDEKEIRDGWEYVLDKKGNVMKDSLGNDIKQPKYVKVHAHVKEVHQTKAARLAAAVELRDLNRDAAIDTRDLSTEIIFEHDAATFRGDERALSDESRRKIGSAPAPFPFDADMIVQAAEQIRPNLVSNLRYYRGML